MLVDVSYHQWFGQQFEHGNAPWNIILTYFLLIGAAAIIQIDWKAEKKIIILSIEEEKKSR